jgi:hypothetical protein
MKFIKIVLSLVIMIFSVQFALAQQTQNPGKATGKPDRVKVMQEDKAAEKEMRKAEKELRKANKQADKADRKAHKAEKQADKAEKQAEKAAKQARKAEKQADKADKQMRKTLKERQKGNKAESDNETKVLKDKRAPKVKQNKQGSSDPNKGNKPKIKEDIKN